LWELRVNWSGLMRILRVMIVMVPVVVGAALLAGTVEKPEGVDGQALHGRYTDPAGRVVSLSGTNPKAVVLVFLNTECPISNSAIPELNRLAGVAEKSRIEFYGVLSDPAVTRVEAQKYVRDYKIAFPMVFDASGSLAGAMKPTHTPEAFVCTERGKILYSGRINDAFAALGKPRAAITANDLEQAIVAAGQEKVPAVVQTAPVGCIFEAWKRPAGEKAAAVTWSRDVAPILYANCTTCHHEGEVAPFSLLTYKDASKRAEMLAAVTASKQMPPWKPASEEWGIFHDERRLTDAQIALLQQWAKEGAPEGPVEEAPVQPVYTDSWQLGTPDLVVKMPKAYAIPASGRDLMIYHVIPLNIASDTYITAFEYKPGNRKVVHHMIAFLDANGNAQKLAKEKGDGDSYSSFGGPLFTPTGGVGGWAPGAMPRFLPEGIGKPLRKGSDLVMQVHYHPSGKAETDQGSLALYLSKKPIKQVSISFPLANRRINIPPNDANYVLTSQIIAPVDLTLFGITPHMHMLGKEMKVTATFADGTTKPLINITDWDWNWQDQYQYTEPVHLPQGTKLNLWARYDNSAENPHNPNTPPQRVTFGEQTTNEMCFAFLQLTVDNANAGMLMDPAAREAIRNKIQQMREQQRGK
jgi:hypothetical protein